MPEASAGVTTLSYIRAVNEALRWALDEYPEALAFGEDVGAPGGPYGASRGLRDAFGDRVFDTPISESAILGAGIGSAICGMRPIVEIMFADFFFVAFDQVINQASNVRYVSNGTQACPLTIRSQQGATPGSCAQHSQCIEAILAHIPGIWVGVPAFPDDAFHMLRAAIASDDPVIVLESRALYPRTGDVRLDAGVESVGGARRLREGRDVTVVTWGRAVHECLEAADRLATEGVEVDMIDLRWINPLDLDPVMESLERTSKLVVVHEANVTAGFGAEVAARAAGEGFWSLDAPVVRVGAPDIRVPAAPSLQSAMLVDSLKVVDAVRGLLSGAGGNGDG
jgi:acetoin:2,6-dichlorophenolindophenol oxidoreductase subunit beta